MTKGRNGHPTPLPDASGASFCSPATRPGARVGLAAIALVVAVVATRVLLVHPLARNGAAAIWLGYVGVWVPLGVGVLLSTGARWFRHRAAAAPTASLPSRVAFGLVFSPFDLVWGVGAGLLARGVDAALSVAVTGSTGLTPEPTLGAAPTGALAAAMIAAPVLVAPTIEELFFRGLLQNALALVLSGPSGGPGASKSANSPSQGAGQGRHPERPSVEGLPDQLGAWTAAALVSIVFAVAHVLLAPSEPLLLTLGGTLMLGLTAGALSVHTARLGGAIVAHIVFNAIAVLLTWPH